MEISAADVEVVGNLLRDEAAIVLEPEKGYLVEARLLSLARRHGCETVSELVGQLKNGSSEELKRDVVEAMTTNETSWFRDVHPFKVLEESVIPHLIEKRREEKALVFWSAAAASGQEIYSIIMLIRDKFPELDSWNIRFVATDISTQMVRKLQEGKYTQMEVNRGLSAKYLIKYFQQADASWQINQEVRKVVEASSMNLISDWQTAPTADVLFLRNVLIYFDLKTKQEVLGKVFKSMRREGFLFLGGAESTMNIDDRFVRFEGAKGGCYQIA